MLPMRLREAVELKVEVALEEVWTEGLKIDSIVEWLG